MTLYEIDDAILSCIDMETGEIIDEEKLTALTMERDAKISGVENYSKNLIGLHGLPTATQLSGIFLTTTLPAPIVTLLPIVIPGRIVTLPPIHTLLPIVTGKAVSTFIFRRTGSIG